MLEPLPSSAKKSVDVAALSELQQLHEKRSIGLTSLTVRGDGVEFNQLAEIIRYNASTLKEIIINHDGDDKKYSAAERFQYFISALKQCINLDTLGLNGFRRELSSYPCDFVRTVFGMPKLRILSLTNTYLGEWGRLFFVNLKSNLTIKELHLEHALDRTMWEWYVPLLVENSTLEKLVLGKSAIKLGYLQFLIMVVTACSSLKCLDWTPDVFYKNKAFYWLNEHASYKEIYRQQLMGESLRDLQESDSAKYKRELSDQDQALRLLNEVQKFITARNSPRSMDVVIELQDERSVDFALIAAVISLHSRVIRNLTIRLQNIEKFAPSASLQKFELFLQMLGLCQGLRSLKIETFQNTFCPSMIRDLFKVLETLPLENLSFNKTFIGPIGVECLVSLCGNNKLAEIDLTLIGLIHKKCIDNLSKCLKSTTSLRTVMLGKSPLTLVWWQMLARAAQSNRNRPELQWQVTHEEAMKAKMYVLCTALHYGDDERLYARDVTFDQFCEEIVDIEQRWTQLPHATTAPTDITVGARGNGIEMQPLVGAGESTRLLPLRQTSYGATSGSRR